MRNISYHQDTTHALICLSLAGNWEDQRVRILEKWVPELKFYLPEAMLFLVGMQQNQVSAIQDSLNMESTRKNSMQLGTELAHQIGALRYFECSALLPSSILEIAEILRSFQRPIYAESPLKSLTETTRKGVEEDQQVSKLIKEPEFNVYAALKELDISLTLPSRILASVPTPALQRNEANSKTKSKSMWRFFGRKSNSLLD
jgi:hypothetical protein